MVKHLSLSFRNHTVSPFDTSKAHTAAFRRSFEASTMFHKEGQMLYIFFRARRENIEHMLVNLTAK